jgi:hypothetical protein
VNRKERKAVCFDSRFKAFESIGDLRFFGRPPCRSEAARKSVKRFLTHLVKGGLHAPISYAGAVGFEPTAVLVNRSTMYVCFAGWGAQQGRKPKLKEQKKAVAPSSLNV